ncbi:hypothetical protein ACOSP7_019936 [Xanthoceras sorbifolium]
MLNSGMKSSNFAQKCSLLSQYLKENGSFGDISLQMTAKKLPSSKGLETCTTPPPPTTTMNLLPILENSAEDYSKQNVVESTNDHSRHQMTIFYAGKVLVLNDFPAEKAEEIMALAASCSNNNNTSSPAGLIGSTTSTTPASAAAASALEKIDSRKAAPFATPDLNASSREVLLHQHDLQPIASDFFPQTRTASLYRFLDKRKERITGRAPYQVNNKNNRLSSSSMDAAAAAAPPPPTPEPSKPWLDLN